MERNLFLNFHIMKNLSISNYILSLLRTTKTIITSTLFVVILIMATIFGSIIHIIIVTFGYVYNPLSRLSSFKYLERKFLEHNLLLFEEIFVFNKLPFSHYVLIFILIRSQSYYYTYYIMYMVTFIYIVYLVVHRKPFRYLLGVYLKDNVSPALLKIYGNPGEAAFAKAAQAVFGKVAQPIAVGSAVLVAADAMAHQTRLSQAAQYAVFKNAGIDHEVAQDKALSSKSLLEKSPYFAGKHDQNASSD